eukprot:15364504-Ditylum_brightwellii.AAC.1
MQHINHWSPVSSTPRVQTSPYLRVPNINAPTVQIMQSLRVPTMMSPEPASNGKPHNYPGASQRVKVYPPTGHNNTGPNIIPSDQNGLPPPKIPPMFIPTQKDWVQHNVPHQPKGPHIIPPESH